MNKKIKKFIREIVLIAFLWGFIFLTIAFCVMVYSFARALWTQAAIFFGYSPAQLLKVTMTSAACMALAVYVYKLTK